MLIIRIIVSGLYALLMIFAVAAQYRKVKKLDALMLAMLAGAGLLLISNFTGHVASLVCAACSILIIHTAALLNGKRNGKMNILHHFIRFFVSIVIFMLFLFS